LVRKTRKIKDKWKEKRWITVLAPDSFNNVPVAYIPITNDKTAIGRVIEVTLFDILKGDPSQHQYKLFFKINKVTVKRPPQFLRDMNMRKNFYEA